MKVWIVEISVPDNFTQSDVISACNKGIRDQFEDISDKQLGSLDYNSSLACGPYKIREDNI